MWKLVCALLCAVVAGSNAIHLSNYTYTVHQMTNYQRAEVAVNKKFYTILKSLKHLDVILDGRRQCHFDIDEKHDMKHEIKATGMINGKIIVWGIRNSANIGYKGDVKTSYFFMIINPHANSCDLKILSDPMEDVTSKDWPKFLPTVIGFTDTFEIFMPSQAKCFPCKYQENGQKLDLPGQIPREQTAPLNAYRIHAVTDYSNNMYGYFYAYNFQNQTSVIKLITRDFRVVKQKYLDHVVEASAATHSMHTRVAVCHSVAVDSYEKEIRCEQYDGELVAKKPGKTHAMRNPKFFIELSKQNYIYLVIQRENVESTRTPKQQLVEVFPIDPRGSAHSPVHYGSHGARRLSIVSYDDNQGTLCLQMTHTTGESSLTEDRHVVMEQGCDRMYSRNP